MVSLTTCFSLNMFSDYMKFLPGEHNIAISDGRKIGVTGKGSVRLTNNLTLKEVLHVPDFHFILISIHKLCKDLHCKMVFDDNVCHIQAPLMIRPLVLGMMTNGLYYVEEKSNGLLMDRKQTRMSFPHSSIKTTFPIETLHVD